MKISIAPLLLGIGLLTLGGGRVLGLTVEVAEDAYSTPTNLITPATGKATSLFISSKESAFIRFDLSNPTVLPGTFDASDIASATLRLYVVSAVPGDLTVHAVTTDWTEKPSNKKSDPEPSVNPVPIATIPSAEVVGKQFVTVDVTAAVRTALGTSGNDFGFAIQTAAATARVRLGSKEGPGLGAAAELEIENSETALPYNTTFGGNVTIQGSLTVSNTFTVEARPNSTGGLNNFIGMNAGAADTTGTGNTFVGHNCGKSDVGGSSNSFYGLNSGSSNTSGQLNCFYGQGSGAFNDSGSNNNYFGQAAGFNSFNGNANNYFGWHAGFATASGSNNAFFGDQAGALNTASNNCFFGSGAGATNSSGTQVCYIGINAGNKTTGSFNTFVGAGAGQFTTSGLGNTFIGNISGESVTLGTNNTFLGGNTGSTLTSESHNTLLGDSTDGAANVTNSTAIGANARVTATNSLVLGSISGVNGAAANANVGIGVTAPNSTLQVRGSFSLPIRTSSTALEGFSALDYVLLLTSASNVVLPDATTCQGRICVLKNLSGAANVKLFTVAGSNQTVDGANVSGGLAVANGGLLYVMSTGANWIKIN